MAKYRMVNVQVGSEVKGLQQIQANLNKVLQKMKNMSEAGLLVAAAEIRKSTETILPLTPVDLGNLRASWFAVGAGGIGTDPMGASGSFKNRLFKKVNPRTSAATLRREHAGIKAAAQSKARSSVTPVVYTGYTANYAFFAHEAIFGSGVNPKLGAEYSRPGSGPKWFETALRRDKKKIFKAVKDNMMIR